MGPGADDWYWSDGRPWTYTNWGPGEPNNWDAGENRVQHLGKFDAVWNDVGEDWGGPAVYMVPIEASESTNPVQNPSIEILEAVVGEPVRFRIKDRAYDNDAWVGIYPTSLEDNDHGEEGDRWKWLKDIDLDSASFPEQSEGRWSIRVFKDGGYAVVSRVDFDILPKKERWWED